MSIVPSVISLIKKYDVRAKKRFSQNFLTPQPTLEKIIAALSPHADDVVVEIGPGLGVMTALLANSVQHVFAVDLDQEMLAIAQQEFGEIKNITWLQQDFLTYDLPSHVNKVLGNIPYEITSQIIFKLIENRNTLQSAVLLMQKEVAERICAKPRTKDYGILSVQCQALTNVKKCFDVSPQSFIPAPKVASSVVLFEFHNPMIAEENRSAFQKLVRASFAQRRKILKTSLIKQKFFSNEQAEKIWAELQISPTARAEELSVEQFVSLFFHLSKHC